MNEQKIDTQLSAPKMSIASAAEFLDVSVQNIHKQLKNKDIICPKYGNKSYITHDIAKKLFNINFEKRRIAVQIVKGGTGKTTTIYNIANCANAYGARVLQIDIDPQGNLTDANGVDADEHPVLIDIIKGNSSVDECIVPICDGMDLLPSRIENVILDNEIINKRNPLDKLLSNILKPVEDNYDFIFIDCPPTMGQAVTAASLYADLILAPLNPDKFSSKGLKILKQEIDSLNRNFNKNISYKVFLNKFSGRTVLSDKAVFSLISDPSLENKVLTTTIQYSQEIPNITDDNKNVFDSLKKSSVREDFDRITREILNIVPSSLDIKSQFKVEIKEDATA